jgi:hypothetical protein
MIRESTSLMATNFKFDILLKIIAELLQLAMCLFRMSRFVFKEPRVPTEASDYHFN